MKRFPNWLWVVALLAGAALWWEAPDMSDTSDAIEAATSERAEPSTAVTQASFLPPEAHRTLERILGGGPHPYAQDGTTFFNREGHLPSEPRGHYREYTVDTPGLNHRGARRIVTGGTPPTHWYYTDDHYDSFRPFVMAPR